MIKTKPLRVAALVDLPRSPSSGGHVKCWERLATAAALSSLPLDLTVYFSGQDETEVLAAHTRIRHLKPLFSTANLKFLPYVPDHTDLAPYHPSLARELSQYDVIHTTDGFFAYSRTAERMARAHHIPIVTSFHTDTPAYTRIFTRLAIERSFEWSQGLRHILLDVLDVPERQGKGMDHKIRKHLTNCSYALVTREEDDALAVSILGRDHVRHLRLGVDKEMFNPLRCDRSAIEKIYGIPDNRIVLLFVGRVDVGKNIYTLIHAMEKLIAEGIPLHLVTAGVGPATEDVQKVLKDHVSVAGYVAPVDLAQLYASVDGLALSSEVEIRSMAGVEAIASGCPILVSEKSNIAQLFDNTVAMQTVVSGVDNWADAICNFSADPEKRLTMHKAALDYSDRHLASWQDVLAEDLFTVWQQAADKKAV